MDKYEITYEPGVKWGTYRIFDAETGRDIALTQRSSDAQLLCVAWNGHAKFVPSDHYASVVGGEK